MDAILWRLRPGHAIDVERFEEVEIPLRLLEGWRRLVSERQVREAIERAADIDETRQADIDRFNVPRWGTTGE